MEDLALAKSHHLLLTGIHKSWGWQGHDWLGEAPVEMPVSVKARCGPCQTEAQHLPYAKELDLGVHSVEDLWGSPLWD